MKLRKVYNVSVSSTICQECETCFTEEPQTANDACHELQTNVSHPGVRNKGSARSNRDKTIFFKKKFHKDDKVSATTVFDSKPRSNLTTLLDLCVHNISILQFMFVSNGCASTEHSRSVTAYSRSVFRNRNFSSMWLTPTEETEHTVDRIVQGK